MNILDKIDDILNEKKNTSLKAWVDGDIIRYDDITYVSKPSNAHKWDTPKFSLEQWKEILDKKYKNYTIEYNKGMNCYLVKVR